MSSITHISFSFFMFLFLSFQCFAQQQIDEGTETASITENSQNLEEIDESMPIFNKNREIYLESLF